jgi:hypothetical protein
MKWREVAQVRRTSECCRDGDGTVFKPLFIVITCAVAVQIVKGTHSKSVINGESCYVMFEREHFLRVP